MQTLGWTIPPHGDERRRWLVGLAYVAFFLALDWISFIRPFQGLNVTPWNPQPALAIALLLWNPRWLALVWLSLVAAELAVRGVPADWFVMLAANGALALVYAAITRVLQRQLGASPSLATRRDLFWLTTIAAGGALVSGTVYLAALAAAGLGPSGALIGAIARYWVGDMVGLVVMLPLLLMLRDAQHRAALFAALRARDAWLIAALIGALLWVVFGRAQDDHLRFFYLLFVPVVWAAAKLGLPGAVLSSVLTQVGLILSVQTAVQPDLTVFELQVLMAAVTLTGLMLGAAVDERERASAELKRSLRFAAAGQMAAALAHEMSQPLTALNSYAQAARMLATARDIDDAERLARLAEVSQRMADDALRASDVVKRLRDFFRTGSTQLQSVPVTALIEPAVQAAQRRAQAQAVRIEVEVDARLRPVWVDPVQVSVVLRNLIGNALDAAAAGGGAGNGRVRVRAQAHDDTLLRVSVLDDGPGVDAARLQHLFDPGPSDKPGGMGVGLSICRAIVEAHGGQLWAEPDPFGHFCFTLPLVASDEAAAQASPRAAGAGDLHAS